MLVTDANVHGTFASEAAAIDSARITANAIALDMAGATFNEMDGVGPDGELKILSVGIRPLGSGPATLVVVRYDDGTR